MITIWIIKIIIKKFVKNYLIKKELQRLILYKKNWNKEKKKINRGIYNYSM